MSNKNKLKLSNTLKRVFTNAGSDKPSIINTLKANYAFEDIKKAIPSVISHPIAFKYIYGTPLPNSYNTLRTGVYTRTCEIDKELNWSVLSFAKFKNEINKFLKLKKEFYDFLLLGKFNQAKEILDSINELSYSTWGLETRLILEDIVGGLEKNKDFLSFVNEQKLEPVVALLAYFYSNKAERKISVSRYATLISSVTADFVAPLKDYFNLKLNFFDTDEFNDWSAIIKIENKSSVFDRYLTFMFVCQGILNDTKKEAEREYVINALEILNVYIEDPFIEHLLYVNGKSEFKSQYLIDSRIIDVFDFYTAGKYIDAISKCKELVAEFPQEFSLYKIYSKSLQYLDLPFQPINDINSISNEILEDVYHVSCKSSNVGNNVARLLKNVSLLQNSSMAHSMYAFYVNSWLSKELHSDLLNEFVSNRIGNPQFYACFDDPKLADNYLNEIKQAFPNSVTIELFTAFNRQLLNIKVDSIEIDNVPHYRKDFYTALAYYKVGEFEKSAELFQSLMNNKPPKAAYEDILVNLFKSYLKLGKLDDCLELYVSNFFQNTNIVLKIDVSEIQKRIERSKFTNISPKIIVPIFFYLTKKDNHVINVALRVFLKNLGVNKPSELEKSVDLLDKHLFTFLLQNICTPEILKYSVFFNSTKDVLNERLNVLQILSSLNLNENNLYKEDIKRISQNLAIIDGIREVDESKIFIDIKGLITYEFNDIRTNFARYIELSNLIQNKKNYISLDVLLNKSYFSNNFWQNESQAEKQEAKMSEDYKFELFKELFIEIVQLYLFSNKYGLDSYLSTRIRHGTLLGQFRSEFQNQQLITQKDKQKEEYFTNTYWHGRLNISEREMALVQTLLAKFSFEIDTIANNLKENIIQIKTFNRNEHGLFDFTYKTAGLKYFYEKFFQNITNYHLFIDSVFVLLVEKTKSNLEVIQDYISDNVKHKVVNLLNDLEREIKQVVDVKEIQELLNNIINCRLHIVTELDKIADWFIIKENVVSDFRVEKVINTSIEITNKLSPKTKLSYSHPAQNTTIIKGEYFIHFFDLLRIFLENASSYSSLTTEELRFELLVEEKDDILQIVIKNNLSPNIDLDVLKDKFRVRKTNLNSPNWDMEKIKKEVGGTGFYKAKNILSSHLKSEKNFFDFFVNKHNEVEINISIDLNNLRA